MTAKERLRAQAERVEAHYRSCRTCGAGARGCRVGGMAWESLARVAVVVLRECVDWHAERHLGEERAARLTRKVHRVVETLTRER